MPRLFGTNIGLRSHKFITGHISQDVANQLERHIGTRRHEASLTDPGISISGDGYTIYVWSFGSVVIHLTEELELPDITSLALWRYDSYSKNLQWATNMLQEISGSPAPKASYVLSFYWLHSPAWEGIPYSRPYK